MPSRLSPARNRLDKFGIVLSSLCAVHCVASIVVVSALGIGGEWLLSPAIHRWGLAVAVVIAGAAIGWGALRHRRRAPFVVAMTGLTFMGGALAAPHGMEEAILTIIGVALVSLGHILNLRHAHGALSRSS
ncbi:MerC domain-containing protein [Erythrobacter sp. LQ02-29]|uniref:MerC domain-containing protein n=1 Tax=unclassified Erythrobacter TaxID=2633097 RepID=UPI001BFC12CF|nr:MULTISPECIES: MerC domain-containing protein [unclassified Erythrobacter]MCP9221870.1 MerC domain-containing protein [Erythrobacter sp. LQ02-29]QWC56772.1 MerC family mercury resistance protein [Erythrobacter sp. 3-20A1M]